MLSRLGKGPLPLDAEDWEAANGLHMPALYAMRAARYMHEYDLSTDDISHVSVKARRHGAKNPIAQLRKEVTLEEVKASRVIAHPLHLFHCCPIGDGAAAIMIASRAYAERTGKATGVSVRASVLHSGHYTPGFRDMTIPEVSVKSARQACEEAAIDPRDVDVMEIHDAFASAELMYYEALGLCGRGEAARLLHDGVTTFGGRNVVNPSGGLLSKGHPVGATGAAQIVEIVKQLQGHAQGGQVENARIGMTHATGGGVSGFDHGACTIHIFERN
jgi:benzoylsuccinyl-CoA thiolase BbsB subunit